MLDVQLLNAFNSLVSGQRVILHVDLDCFYCQVEQVRLGLDPKKPLAVQQWQGLIAVNYPARRAGVSNSVAEALKHCPDIRMVHVATYAGDGQPAAYHERPRRQTHKVCLDSYRRASKRIIKVFETFTSNIQKASVDEAFIDVTSLVIERLYNFLQPELIEKIRKEYTRERDMSEVVALDIFCPTVPWHTNTHIIADENATSIESEVETMMNAEREGLEPPKLDKPVPPKECTDWSSMFLNLGAAIATDIRRAVYDELCYTCSIGIANNKILAKLGSGLNKPDQQTMICASGIKQTLRNYPLRKLKYFSGKLGDELQAAYDVETPKDVWKYSLAQLEEKISIKNGALLAYNAARGIGSDELKAHHLINSMISVKTFFYPLKTMEAFEQWIDILSIELFSRIQDEYETNNRWPYKLSFSYTVINDITQQKSRYSSKNTPMISRKELITPDLLGNRTLRLLRNMPVPIPCRGLSIFVSQFKAEQDPRMDITRFFKTSTPDTIELAESTSITPLIPRPPSPKLKTHISAKPRVLNEYNQFCRK
ncbi:hypothetical protein BDF19DRAFT_176689 [Syncephalis fuscata]|nr:hypothetical protein BDF19DRAFT_176689 [Syncephalis fuscata]